MRKASWMVSNMLSKNLLGQRMEFMVYFCVTCKFQFSIVNNFKFWLRWLNFISYLSYYLKNNLSRLIQDCQWATPSNFCYCSRKDKRCSCLWMSLLCNIWKLFGYHSKRYVEWSKRGWFPRLFYLFNTLKHTVCITSEVESIPNIFSSLSSQLLIMLTITLIHHSIAHNWQYSSICRAG